MRLAIFFLFQVHTSTDARVRNVIKLKTQMNEKEEKKTAQQKGLEYILGQLIACRFILSHCFQLRYACIDAIH